MSKIPANIPSRQVEIPLGLRVPMKILIPTAMPASWPERPTTLARLRTFCRPRRNLNRRLLAQYLSADPLLWTKLYV